MEDAVAAAPTTTDNKPKPNEVAMMEEVEVDLESQLPLRTEEEGTNNPQQVQASQRSSTSARPPQTWGETCKLICWRIFFPVTVIFGCLAFCCGATINFLADCCSTADAQEKRQEWREARSGIAAFCRESHFTEEMKQGLVGVGMVANARVINAVQRHEYAQGRPHACRIEGRKNNTSEYFANNEAEPQLLDKEVHRYMRYATAAYGPQVIANAAFETGDRLPPSPLAKTRSAVMRHVGVENKNDNVIVMDMDLGEDVTYLRHYSVIDHRHKAVVLAIRGTISVSSTLVDIAGYVDEQDFVPGIQAHKGMAKMARGIWRKSGPAIVERLQSLPDDYELVITGHSLGAGVAGLVHLLVHERGNPQGVDDEEESMATVPATTPIRAFLFAGPPTVSTIRHADSGGEYLKAVQNCTTVIFQDDIVPHIGVNALRRYSYIAAAVRKLKISYLRTVLLDHEFMEPDDTLLTTYRTAVQAELPVVPNAPMLIIPSHQILWIERSDDNCKQALLACQRERYTCTVCDAEKVAALPMVITLSSVADHLTGRYEYCLQYAEVE